MSSSSSFPRSSRLSPRDGDNTVTSSVVSTETNPADPSAAQPSTTTTFIPFPTSSSPPPQPGAFFTGGASTPLIAGFISIGAFAVAIIATCACYKFMRRRRAIRLGIGPAEERDSDFVHRFLPARFRRGGLGEGGGGGGGEEHGGHGHGHGHEHRRGRRRWRHGQGRQRRRSNELGKAKPEMFDAWVEKGQRTTSVDDTLKWEATESLPLSATLFTTGPPGPGPGPVETAAGTRDSVEVQDEEKRSLSVQQMRHATTSSGTLQVAVLLQMPSPPSHTVTEAENDIGVRGELAIGLVEAPWTIEHHPSCSREGQEITIS